MMGFGYIEAFYSFVYRADSHLVLIDDLSLTDGVFNLPFLEVSPMNGELAALEAKWESTRRSALASK